MENPASRFRADEGGLFTSSKCPPGPGLENCCELPFGFIWTPMAPSNTISKIICRGEALPPVICLTCLAYLNLYAELDVTTGIWMCPLCGEKNVAPKEEFLQGGQLAGVLSTPVVEYHQRIGANNSSNPEENALDACTYVLCVDANLARDEATGVFSAIQAFFRDLSSSEQHCKINLGLVVFDKVVSMYQLGLSGMASADIFTPSEANDEEMLLARKNDMEHRSYLAHVEPGDELTSLWRCLSAVFGVSIETSNGGVVNGAASNSRTEQLRRKKEARIRKEQMGNGHAKAPLVQSPWITNRNMSATGHAMRCTGEAIQCALDLTGVGKPYPSRTSRILLFTNGCPNFGDGSVVVATGLEASSQNQNRPTPDVVDPMMLARAVEYFDMTATYALENGVGVDVFCTGKYYWRVRWCFWC
jgi:hypothetical protein